MTALLALLLAAAPAPAAPEPVAPELRLEQANAQYLAGDFDAAARTWRSLVDEGWESTGLHLDLGNALLRLGFRGRAIASYLRGLELDPGDADLRANLETARTGNVDRLPGEADRPLHQRLLARTPDWLALLLFGAGWSTLWLLLWLRGRAAASTRRELGLAALAAALLAVVGGALLAGREMERRTPTAVVISPAAPVREGPSRTLKGSFELHEGTTVRVLEARGDLARVQLENGLTGWLASADLEVI